jgi:DNA repair protein RadC
MEQLLLFADEPRPPKTRSPPDPQEYKVVALRDCPTPADMHMCDTPEAAVSYWRMHIQPHPWFDSERECLVVLLLNTRRRVKGHQLISTGTLDCLLVHAREVFRAAIVAAAHSIILIHNHPSGDPSPSEADIRITRDLMRSGSILKIPVLDHIVIGNPRHTSLRELGYVNL